MVIKISQQEKEELINNAISSFEHGIEHLLSYEKDETSIKFSILHIFNALELIVKAYLLTINKALLWPDVDRENKIKTADISMLIKRMSQFSDKKFNKNLIDNIEKLRKKRNEIEHRKFVIEKEGDLMIILFSVIEEIMIFLKNSLYSLDNNQRVENIIKKWENEYFNPYFNMKINFDKRFKEISKTINSINEKNENIYFYLCNNCMLKTVPYLKNEQTKIKCLNCGKEMIVIKCTNCNDIFFVEEDDINVFYHGWEECEKCRCLNENIDIKSHKEVINSLEEKCQKRKEKITEQTFKIK